MPQRLMNMESEVPTKTRDHLEQLLATGTLTENRHTALKVHDFPNDIPATERYVDSFGWQILAWLCILPRR